MRNLQYLLGGLLILATMPLSGQEVVKKAAVPTEAAQAEATKVFKEVYVDEYARAKTTTEKQALAKKLLGKASESKDDPAAQFVMLRLARDIAVQASDWQTASQAIDAMAKVFQMDANEMKLTVLTKFASAAVKPEQHQTVAEEALRQMDQAVSEDNFTVADQFGKLALAEANKGRDKALVVHVQGLVTETGELNKAYESAKTGKATLATKPDDPEANLVVGKFLCFVKGQWEKGLPMLALAKDDVLGPLAKQEVEGALPSPESKEFALAMVKLGDAWWDLAGKQEGRMKKQIQAHAGHWYRLAPGLTGLTKDKVEKRIKEIAPPEEKEILLITNGTGTRKEAQTIVGKWKRELGDEVVDFQSNGYCTTTIDSSTIGKWFCVDKMTRRYQISWPKWGITRMILSADGDTLVFKDFLPPDNKNERWNWSRNVANTWTSRRVVSIAPETDNVPRK